MAGEKVLLLVRRGWGAAGTDTSEVICLTTLVAGMSKGRAVFGARLVAGTTVVAASIWGMAA